MFPGSHVGPQCPCAAGVSRRFQSAASQPRSAAVCEACVFKARYAAPMASHAVASDPSPVASASSHAVLSLGAIASSRVRRLGGRGVHWRRAMAAFRCCTPKPPSSLAVRTVAAGSHVRDPSFHSVRYSHVPMQVGVARAAWRCTTVWVVVWAGCTAMLAAASHATAPVLALSSECRLS